ncbi:Vitamin K epoxide reductase complex subunit 1-like protein 1 [Holothuria leucospilota]|uniref:vitamin-K-epoxide reductase (warfarin-sensitive) n=1 Tax=Holothuria leucospilota TaxID=206669 RepID=A0A9Q1CF70_HOLLE|nr:Vitamin K epoxide reductase complex subunit 1-like protein 1 [Holothuria leucospilota]
MASKTVSRPKVSILQIYAGFLLCIAGIGLSLYAFNVETKKESDKDYTAMCDIGDRISCSKVFTSKYGRGFGLIEPILGKDNFLNVPNSIYGLVFYSLQMYLCTVHTPRASLFMLVNSLLSNAGSIYLACILYFVLEDACVVCISTYMVNFLLLLLSVMKWRQINSAKKKSD